MAIRLALAGLLVFVAGGSVILGAALVVTAPWKTMPHPITAGACLAVAGIAGMGTVAYFIQRWGA